MTFSPTDYRAPWPAPSGRDLAYAAGYRAALADSRQRRDRLVAVAVVSAIVLFGWRRHPLVGLAIAVAVVGALWPVLATVLVGEMALRHHRRHRSWARTLAYALTWMIGLGLVALAVANWSAWPLLGAAGIVAAWTVGPRLLGAYRRHRDRGPR